MKKLIIIRGNSGSGKTTLAKRLQKEFGRNTMLISQDVIRRDMLMVKDGADTKALFLLIELMKYGKRNSEITILEGILDAEWYKPLFKAALEEYGKIIYAYYYNIPFEETMRRHKTRSNCNDFGEEDMRAWWKEKDLMESVVDIVETKFTSELSEEDAVNKVLNDVKADDRRKSLE